MSRIAVAKPTVRRKRKYHSGNSLKVICGEPNAWEPIRQQLELPRPT